MTNALVVATLVLTAVGWIAASPNTPPGQALEAMAEAERVFARTALEKGIRDAFVEFFANDSIGFYPTPMNAREFYRSQPPSPLSTRLEWEPRTGDVAASGDLGWLTGPFSLRNTASPDAPPRYGCYFSLWRKQDDGRWKVLMDVGINTPGAVAFAPGFQPVAEPVGRAKEGAATRDVLLQVDRDLSAALAREGSPAYGRVVTASSRLHVPGQPPIGGTDIMAWLASADRQSTFTPDAGEIARSGELGFTRGSYEHAGAAGTSESAKAEKGYYVRTWKRVADGSWTIGVEVRNPLPPPRTQ